jgi:hypothetical protein
MQEVGVLLALGHDDLGHPFAKLPIQVGFYSGNLFEAPSLPAGRFQQVLEGLHDGAARPAPGQ